MSLDQAVIGGNFDMGRVVKATFAAVQRHAMILFPAAFVLTAIPNGLAMYSIQGVPPEQIFAAPLYWVSLVLSILAACVLQAMVVHTVVNGHKGAETSLPSSFAASLKSILPLFLVSVLAYLGAVLGSILLVVPGIILMVMWIVAGPAVVVEGVGPIKALGRSRALTKGSRWPIFGLLFVGILISFVISFGIYGFNFAAMSAASASPQLPQVLATIVIGTITSVITFCGLAAIYSELRMVKEGASNDQLATVFD
jgi:hypothetical protein